MGRPVGRGPTAVSAARSLGTVGGGNTLAAMKKPALFVTPRFRASAAIARRASVHVARLGLAALLGSAGVVAGAADSGVAALRAAYASQRAELESSRFGKPLTLRSQQSDGALKGDIHAVLDQPFDRVRAALAEPRNWCDILIL